MLKISRITVYKVITKLPSADSDRGFSKLPEVGIIGICVLLKYENELEINTIDIGFNSVNP